MKDLPIKKLYYSISEVSKITDLEQYVLRYWETEFDELKPSKNRAGNRIYTSRDIQLILYIKKLLREDHYTIEGAKLLVKDFKPTETDTFIKEKEAKEMQLTFENADNTLTADVRRDLLETKALLQTILSKLSD